MPALISGSLAFDTIMNFEGKFSDQILADHIHKLNVSFFVPTLRREPGGCAGNIAYALKQLGGEPLPLAAHGPDGAEYAARFEALGISTEFLSTVAGSYTAQAMIMTDRDNNQITAFHPGAMSQAHLTPVPANGQSSKGKIALGIVSPNGRDAMIEHAAQFKAAGVPFIFDPGQGLPMFGGDDLRAFISQATWVTVNDYEGEMLCERTGMSFAQISEQVEGLVVTLGEHGCDVWVKGQCTRVAPVKASAVVDPTGCGDAFRGALLFGLERGWDLARCCALGNRLGALKIAERGGQNYQLPAGYALA
jgi:adenosine kinase